MTTIHLSLQKKIIISGMLLLTCVIGSMFILSGHKTVSQPIRQKSFSSPHTIKGLTYSTYEDNRLTATMKADAFGIEPRKFWAFNIRPFKDAVLVNAAVQVYLDRDRETSGNGSVNMLSFGKDLLNLGSRSNSAAGRSGLVSRGVIKGFVMEIYEDKRPSILVTAKKAYIDSEQKKLKMMNVSMEDVASGNRIKSRAVMWNNNKSVFEIAGRYTARTKEGITKGEHIKVDLDFNVTPLT